MATPALVQANADRQTITAVYRRLWQDEIFASIDVAAHCIEWMKENDPELLYNFIHDKQSVSNSTLRKTGWKIAKSTFPDPPTTRQCQSFATRVISALPQALRESTEYYKVNDGTQHIFAVVADNLVDSSFRGTFPIRVGHFMQPAAQPRDPKKRNGQVIYTDDPSTLSKNFATIFYDDRDRVYYYGKGVSVRHLPNTLSESAIPTELCTPLRNNRHAVLSLPFLDFMLHSNLRDSSANPYSYEGWILKSAYLSSSGRYARSD